MAISLSRICVEGEDATTFLQGQITADINHLNSIPPGESVSSTGLAALCNRQGRVITLFWIRKTEKGYHLLLPTELAEKVAQYLQIFIFRAKVSLTVENVDEADLATLPQMLIIPWITKDNSESYIPQMLSLDLLGAISFKKGCYTGQEIVARMQYLGKHKRRLALIEADNTECFTINGQLITEDQQTAGEIVYFEENHALIVLRLAEKDKQLYLADHPTIAVSIKDIWHNEESDH